MIKGRKISENIIRPRQNYDTRLNKVRLGMNEKYPSMPKELFQEIMSDFTIEADKSNIAIKWGRCGHQDYSGIYLRERRSITDLCTHVCNVCRICQNVGM